MAKFPERVVSGMRPTGRLHIGHYFGVLVNYLKLQETHDCFFMIADLHALTTGDLSKNAIGANTREVLLDWLAAGVDPSKATVFVQSNVPEHSELAQLMGMVATVGALERSPTYKEMRDQLGDSNTNSLGLLSYPVLQSVDVCLYKGTKVPVGEDQKPHLEMGRELIRRFNSTYKKTVFPEFEALTTAVSKLPGLDGRKMSKSYGNAIDLAEDPASIRKRIKSMLTDPGRPRRSDPGHPEVCPVFTYHQLFTPAERVEQIAAECRSAELGCGDDKEALAERVIAWQEPFLKRRRELEKDDGYLLEVLQKGREKARAVASKTLSEVWSTMGLWPSRNP
jgi:tryptophanyl-tRNA synthetase